MILKSMHDLLRLGSGLDDLVDLPGPAVVRGGVSSPPALRAPDDAPTPESLPSPTYVWIGPSAGGDWNTASNWQNTSTGDYGVPGGGDVVDTTSASRITTDGASVAGMYAGGMLVGDLTVTGELEGGTLTGGAVSVGEFAGGTFEGESLSAGLIDYQAKLDAGSVSAGQIAEAFLSGATVSAGELAPT